MPPKKTKASDTKEKKPNSKKVSNDSEESDDQSSKKTSKTLVKSGTKTNNKNAAVSKENSGAKANSAASDKKDKKKIQISDSESDDKELFPPQPIKKNGIATKEIEVKVEESSEEEQIVNKKTQKGKSSAAATTAKTGRNKKVVSESESIDEEEENIKTKRGTKNNKNEQTAENQTNGKRTSRNIKVVSYIESEEEEYSLEEEGKESDDNDEDNDDDFDDDFEESDNKKKKGNKRKAKRVSDKSQESDSGEINGEKKKGGNNNKKEHVAKKSTKAPLDSDDNHIIDVQKEQGKVNVEDQYELPYFLNKEYIKDSEGRSINDPNYDPTTLFIPIQELKKETPLFQQYWKIKVKHFDKVVFFRFGRNFVCFYNDAILIKKLFDGYVGLWGKRPVANVFDNHYRFYVKELLEKADKSCIVVDQVQFNDDRTDEQQLIKREVTQIITKGTYTDYVDNVDDYNARYLMCVVESATDHSFGIALIDCTTHLIYLDDIKNDPAGNQIRTILRKMKPVEIHSVFQNLSEQTKNICKTTCKPQFTFDKSFEFHELQDIFDELKNEFRQKIYAEKSDSKKKEDKMEIEKKNNKNKKKNQKKKEEEDDDDDSSDSDDNEDRINGEDDEESESEEEDDEEAILNINKPQVKKEPKFTYGELSSDYPVLLRDIEEMYNIDKKKFEEQLLKKQKNPKSEMSEEDEDDEDPCFDFEFQYYMMLQALMLSLTYLRKLKLNDNVFRLGAFSLLDSTIQKNTYLHLDAHAIENLDIFEVNLQNRVTSQGSLMGFIDYTKTQFGRRMLKRWLSYPLKSISQIEQRQEAIEDLMQIENVVDQFDKKLSKLGDLERQISKIFNSTQKSRLKPSSFENFSNVRLKDAYTLVQDLKNLEELLLIFKDYSDNFKSSRLRKLVTVKDPNQITKMLESNKMMNSQKQSYLQQKLLNKQNSDSKSKQQIIVGIFPDLKPFVELIENQLEQDEQGYCQPKAGADSAYDEIVFKIKKIYKKMNQEANIWRKKLNNLDIKLVKSKMQWEIQIPEKLVEGSKKPKELYLTSKIKSFQRFQTDKIIKLCSKLKKQELKLSKALSPFCEKFFHLFYQNRDLLYQAVNCISELDCLCSLSKCSLTLKVRCKPTFVAENYDKNVFELRDMYHPQLLKEGKQNLIPNDTIFESGITCMLVTGPNMGGKSTLLRQTCLAVILAQLGCFLPAKSFKTMIRDRIFCRIGASDRLLEGKSTFLVEMEETGDIVKEATNQSLVLLDELGRGTSTFDGVSIAYGVLRYLVDNVKCLTLFSTHYHMLVDEFKLYKSVQSYVMQFDFCSITKTIDFKYKYVKGYSDKSFGINVAKMAGLPDCVVNKAHQMELHMSSEDQNIGNLLRITKSYNSIIEALHHDDATLMLFLNKNF